MGNSALTCFRSRGHVKVVLLSGDSVEFRKPVTALIVMKKYPHHLVLHCSKASNSKSGNGRQISILKPYQELKSRQNYLIVPTQYVRHSRFFIDSWAFFALNTCSAKTESRRRRKPISKKGWWFPKVFSSFFRSRQSRFEEEDEWQPLLMPDEASVQAKSSTDAPHDWRPSLDCIPESSPCSPDLNQKPSYSAYHRLGQV